MTAMDRCEIGSRFRPWQLRNGRQRCRVALKNIPFSQFSRFAAIALLATVAFSGCTAANQFTVEELPPELQAEPFENVQTAELINLAAPSESSNNIGAGDLVKVTISSGLITEQPHTFDVRVNERTGVANLRLIGPMRLAGMDVEEAEAEIAGEAVRQQFYKNPYVTVEVKKRRMNRVLVLGAVKDEGIQMLPNGATDLLRAISSAGGLAKNAGRNVEIRNPLGAAESAKIAGMSQNEIIEAGYSASASGGFSQPISIDLVSATKSAGRTNFAIQDGAVVYIERLDPEPLKVIGLVNKQDTYDFPLNEPTRLLDAIAMADGVSNGLADKVIVRRQLEGAREPAVIVVSIRKAKKMGAENLLLKPGDTVSVEQTAQTVFLDTLKIIRFAVGTSLNTLF